MDEPPYTIEEELEALDLFDRAWRTLGLPNDPTNDTVRTAPSPWAPDGMSAADVWDECLWESRNLLALIAECRATTRNICGGACQGCQS
jgi:hypothetical protein